jgi:hypothetical protein
MEPKAKTIIERHGFRDTDRKDSVHDQIQIWTFKNFRSVLETVFPEQKLPDMLPTPELEWAVTDRNFIVGFVDIYLCGIAVEVKSKIPVVGDLIRQINFYRKYIGAQWLVVSPDDRFVDLLKSQGIKFFKYKNPGELF